MIKATDGDSLLTKEVWLPRWLYEGIPLTSATVGILVAFSPYGTGAVLFVASMLLSYAAGVYSMRIFKW